MVTFMLCSNQAAKELHRGMFNDSILALYVVLCIWFMIKQQPTMAALAVTLGLSIKAGVMLVMPGFLGWVQYKHGPLYLFKALFVVVAV